MRIHGGERTSSGSGRDGDFRPRQGTDDEVLFFVGVEDVDAALRKAEELGGTIVQSAQHVPGTSFGVFADAQGHKVGVAANG
jgi:uncharacterized protein